jgi:hypothetical protein
MPLTKIQSQDAGGATSVAFEALGTAHELLFTWINFDPTGGSDDTLSFQVTTSSYAYNAPIMRKMTRLRTLPLTTPQRRSMQPAYSGLEHTLTKTLLIQQGRGSLGFLATPIHP